MVTFNYESDLVQKILAFQEFHKDKIENVYLQHKPELVAPVIVILLKNGDKIELESSLEEINDTGAILMRLDQIYNKYMQAKSPDPNVLVEANPAFDPVSRPSHYTEGREYEPKDVIYDWGLDFNLGCAVKYISRAGRKDDIVQDLEKAKQYIQFEIDAIQKKRDKERA